MNWLISILRNFYDSDLILKLIKRKKATLKESKEKQRYKMKFKSKGRKEGKEKKRNRGEEEMKKHAAGNHVNHPTTPPMTSASPQWLQCPNSSTTFNTLSAFYNAFPASNAQTPSKTPPTSNNHSKTSTASKTSKNQHPNFQHVTCLTTPTSLMPPTSKSSKLSLTP